MLKALDDGLSKSWRPVKTQESFYGGGKFELASSETGQNLFCIHGENVSIVDWDKGILTSRLLEPDTDSDAVDMITSFCVHPNGKEIVVALRNFLLRHYIIGEKEPVRSIRGHMMPVLTMSYDGTGTLVATGSADKTVRVWDIPRGHCTHSFREHSDIVQLVKFHPNPARLILFSTSDDSTLRMYDLKKSTVLACFRQHLNLPTAIAFAEDGNLMASAGRDQVLNFYDINGKQEHIKTIPVMDELESVVILSKEHSSLLLGIAAVSNTGAVVGKKRARAADEAQVLLTGGLKGLIRAFRLTYDASIPGSFSCSPLFEMSTLQMGTECIDGATSSHFKSNGVAQDTLLRAIKDIVYMKSTSQLIAVTADSNFCCYNITGGNRLEWSRQVVGTYDDILDVALIPSSVKAADSNEDNETMLSYKVAVVSNSTLVHLIDENQKSEPLSGHTDTVLAVDASPDGHLLITSAKDRTCRVWDLTTMSCCAVAEGHTEAVGCVSIAKKVSTYGNNQVFAVSGAGDKILKRWALPIRDFSAYNSGAPGAQIAPVSISASHSVRAHDKDINTVVIAPNDSIIASGSQDHSIRLWKATDLSPLATLTGHKRGVWKIAFSPVDRSLASASGDRTVRLWSLNDNSCLRTFQGHTASVLNVRFVNHGTQLISSASDGLLNLWTIRNGDCENTFDVHEDKVWALTAISEKHFLSGGSDARLILWMDETSDVEKDRLLAAENDLLTEQQLANDIRNKNYAKAFTLALQLGHSNKILGILIKILDIDANESEIEVINSEGLCIVDVRAKRLDELMAPLTEEEIEKLLLLVADWNTNAKYSFVSQAVIASLFRALKADKFVNNRKFSDLVAGLLSYSDRHYHRIDRLNEASYLIDFISGQLGATSKDATALSKSN